MNILYLDIETIPAEESYKDGLRDGTLLSRTKRRELREKNRPVSEAEVEALYRDTALDGDFGRILCIGLRKDPVHRRARTLSGDEPRILNEFWREAEDADLLVGHNVLHFDLRYIYKRSVVHRVRPSRRLPMLRGRSEPVFDTMVEWNRGCGERVSLDRLARILELPSSKKDLSGEKVYNAYMRGELERIYEYCKADVELTRLVHRRMAFLD